MGGSDPVIRVGFGIEFQSIVDVKEQTIKIRFCIDFVAKGNRAVANEVNAQFENGILRVEDGSGSDKAIVELPTARRIEASGNDGIRDDRVAGTISSERRRRRPLFPRIDENASAKRNGARRTSLAMGVAKRQELAGLAGKIARKPIDGVGQRHAALAVAVVVPSKQNAASGVFTFGVMAGKIAGIAQIRAGKAHGSVAVSSANNGQQGRRHQRRSGRAISRRVQNAITKCFVGQRRVSETLIQRGDGGVSAVGIELGAEGSAELKLVSIAMSR